MPQAHKVPLDCKAQLVKQALKAHKVTPGLQVPLVQPAPRAIPVVLRVFLGLQVLLAQMDLQVPQV